MHAEREREAFSRIGNYEQEWFDIINTHETK